MSVLQSLLDAANADKQRRGKVSSLPTNQPPVSDEFASPLSLAPNYEGPAPRSMTMPRGGSSSSQQDVWDAIARRHPRKFVRALAYMKWLERMEKRYSSKII